MEREKKLVTLSMVVLFFSLIVVYSLFYQVKGEKLLQLLRSTSSSETSLSQGETTGENQILYLDLLTGAEQQTSDFAWENLSDSSTWNDAIKVESWWLQPASTGNHLSFEGESPTMLSGTDLYFGAVESVELLGLEPEYLLKDSRGFYYAKLAKEPDFKQTVQDLGGNLYTIDSEADLLKNQLFGERVSFVNLPEYKNKIVIMLLTLEDQHWLVQMEYAKYHHAKSYLKTLFTQ